MACVARAGAQTSYYLEAGGTTKQTASDSTINVCTATKILDRLHSEFTEQYVATASAGRTVNAVALNIHPTFYLRKQPTLNGFQGESTAGNINRLNKYLQSSGSDDQSYRSAVHAIMNGVFNGSIASTTYLNEVTSSTRNFTTSDAHANNFKGIYGLKKLNEELETKIAEKVKTLSTTIAGSKLITEVQHYDTRQGIKTTLEEIARRENEIYREKFLHIMLVVVGIFLVSSQLVSKYFSFGGGGGTSGGFGFGSGNLFTGFGLGSGSGLFSRFGGLGLGRSGRSRITSMFSNNPYSLSNR
jgi:hypothetical protein